MYRSNSLAEIQNSQWPKHWPISDVYKVNKTHNAPSSDLFCLLHKYLNRDVVDLVVSMLQNLGSLSVGDDILLVFTLEKKISTRIIQIEAGHLIVSAGFKVILSHVVVAQLSSGQVALCEDESIALRLRPLLTWVVFPKN